MGNRLRALMPWLVQGLHVIVFISVIGHLFPSGLIEKWKEPGYLAIFFLGGSLVLAIVVNLVLHLKSRNIEARLTQLHNEERVGLNERLKKYENELREGERLKSYAQTFEYLNIAFSRIHHSERDFQRLDEREQKLAIRDFCTKLSQTFEIITGEKCHVCIKIFSKRNRKNPEKINLYEVSTFERDSLHNHRAEVDQVKAIHHLVKDNTDYEEVFLNIRSLKGRYFFSNDLCLYDSYKNTSFLRHGNSITYFPPATAVDHKMENWPLQYRSVICAAICPGISTERSSHTLIGFLCVDCETPNVFIEKIDAEILCGCADGLYNPLKIFSEAFLNKN